MIGRKLAMLGNVNMDTEHHEDTMLISGVVDFDKIKNTTLEGLKKFEHDLIWVILRTYLVTKNILKRTRKELAGKIKARLHRHHSENEIADRKEVSGYIKIISDYRQKIKHIKHKIKEEEGIE
jgi:hypothetical protein